MHVAVFLRKSRRLLYDAMGSPLRLMSKAVRRNPNKWVFGNTQGFRDNTRYLFLHVLRELPEIEATWIANNRDELRRVEACGGTAVLRRSWGAVMAVARAGVGVVCVGLRDLTQPITRDLLVVNLYHGIPLKKLGLDTREELEVIPGFSVLNRLNSHFLRRSLNRYDMVIAASRLTQHRFETAFGLPAARLPICGQARLDILYSGCQGGQLQRECSGLPKRIILYAPTWRESGKDPLEFLDLDTCNAELARRGVTLLLKLHPLSKAARASGTPRSHVRVITDADVEFTHLLFHTDVLISDYSSALLDFALLGRPQLIFAPDAERYAQSRGLYESLEAAFDDSILCATQDHLLAAVARALEAPEEFRAASEKIAHRFYDFFDGRNCARASAEIIACLAKRRTQT